MEKPPVLWVILHIPTPEKAEPGKGRDLEFYTGMQVSQAAWQLLGKMLNPQNVLITNDKMEI